MLTTPLTSDERVDVVTNAKSSQITKLRDLTGASDTSDTSDQVKQNAENEIRILEAANAENLAHRLAGATDSGELQSQIEDAIEEARAKRNNYTDPKHIALSQKIFESFLNGPSDEEGNSIEEFKKKNQQLDTFVQNQATIAGIEPPATNPAAAENDAERRRLEDQQQDYEGAQALLAQLQDHADNITPESLENVNATIEDILKKREERDEKRDKLDEAEQDLNETQTKINELEARLETGAEAEGATPTGLSEAEQTQLDSLRESLEEKQGKVDKAKADYEEARNANPTISIDESLPPTASVDTDGAPKDQQLGADADNSSKSLKQRDKAEALRVGTTFQQAWDAAIKGLGALLSGQMLINAIQGQRHENKMNRGPGKAESKKGKKDSATNDTPSDDSPSDDSPSNDSATPDPVEPANSLAARFTSATDGYTTLSTDADALRADGHTTGEPVTPMAATLEALTTATRNTTAATTPDVAATADAASAVHGTAPTMPIDDGTAPRNDGEESTRRPGPGRP